MRPIDADDRIEFIKNAYCLECDNYNGVRCRACPINDTIEAIDDAPTIDQWHYPSKGEYPKEGETVLLLTNEGDPHLGHFANDYYWETDSFVRTSACIKCWQYIVPPKEDKI